MKKYLFLVFIAMFFTIDVLFGEYKVIKNLNPDILTDLDITGGNIISGKIKCKIKTVDESGNYIKISGEYITNSGNMSGPVYSNINKFPGFYEIEFLDKIKSNTTIIRVILEVSGSTSQNRIEFTIKYDNGIVSIDKFPNELIVKGNNIKEEVHDDKYNSKETKVNPDDEKTILEENNIKTNSINKTSKNESQDTLFLVPEGTTKESAETLIWDYFLLPEGTVKEFIDDKGEKFTLECYEISKKQSGTIVLTIRERRKTMLETSKSFWTRLTDTIYNLDPTTKKVLEVEKYTDSPYAKGSTNRRDYDYPRVVLDEPLEIGKEWQYQIQNTNLEKEMFQVLGIKLPDFKKERRKVTQKKKITVPAGTFDVYVIQVTYPDSPLWTDGKPAYNTSYEYYAKNIGLVATGYYASKNDEWVWATRLSSISNGNTPNVEIKSGGKRREGVYYQSATAKEIRTSNYTGRPGILKCYFKKLATKDDQLAKLAEDKMLSLFYIYDDSLDEMPIFISKLRLDYEDILSIVSNLNNGDEITLYGSVVGEGCGIVVLEEIIRGW